MHKVLLVIFAATVMCGARVSGQASIVSKSHVDSAEIYRRVHKSVDSLTNLIHRTPDNQALTNLYVRRGFGEATLNQPDSAIHDFSSALTLNPKLPDVYAYRAAQNQRIKNFEAGISDLQKAIALLQYNPVRASLLYSSMAFMQRQLKNYDKAIKADSAAIELNPNNSYAYANNGWAYLELKQYDKAVESFDAAVPLYMNGTLKARSEVIAGRGDAKRMLKKYKDAINDYSQALNLDPDNRHARWNRAACYNKNGDYELADAEYTKTIAYYAGENASLAMLYFDRANMEAGEQKYREAMRDDSTAITYNNQYAPAYWSMADAHAQNADFQLSIDWYKETLKYYTGNKAAQSSINDNIANEAYFLGQYEQTISSSTTAIELNGKSWSPHLNRGRAYLKLGNKDKAIDDFNKVLALDTTKKSYEYAFALFYTGNADKAIKVMQDNAVNTTNPALLRSHYYNIACLYSLMNKPDEANTYLKKCIDDGYPKKYVQLDPDLENIRNTSDFKAMMTAK